MTTTTEGQPDWSRNDALLGISTYVLWGSLTIYWKLLREFQPFDLIGWRILSSAAVITVVLTVRRRWSVLRPILGDARMIGRVAISAVLLTINWSSYVWAVVHGRVIETALGYFMAPLGTMLIGVVVFHERLRAAQRLAVLLAVAAIVVLTVSYGSVPWVAVFLAVSWSLYSWSKKQVPLTPLESMSAETYLLVVPALAAVVVLSGRSNSVPSSASTGDIVLVGLSGLATVIPLMMFARAATRLPLTLLGPMQYAIPTINFLLGWLAYDEALPTARIVGFGLVWLGLAVLTWDSVRRSRRAGSSRAQPSSRSSSPPSPTDALAG